MRLILSTLFLIACLSINWNLAATGPKADYLKLAIVWQPSFCYQKGTQSRSAFSIHGLWPEFTRFTRDGHKSLPLPHREVFDPFAIYHIKSNLNLHWPTLDPKSFSSNTEFWKYQWIKHGRYTKDIPNFDGVTAYFEKALEFFFVLDYMNCSDLQLDRESYTLDDLEAKLLKNFDTEIICTKFRGKTYLLEVRYCFSSDSHNDLIDCPNAYEQDCGNGPIYIRPPELSLWDQILNGFLLLDADASRKKTPRTNKNKTLRAQRASRSNLRSTSGSTSGLRGNAVEWDSVREYIKNEIADAKFDISQFVFVEYRKLSERLQARLRND